jgi:hypothetical protein
LQRIIRHVPNSPPFKTPCFCIACNAYSEQLGQYLHEGGSMGETNLRYILMGAMANFLISANTTVFTNLAALAKPVHRARKLLVQLLKGSLCGGRTRGDHEVHIIR